ncbi:little elongation complex subunit 2 [Heptranchias perlo]|uniref:little elongation complex subunit 2 n=1 Tax=Heptranchias perlo TaxID=212740 RepID=UPI003559909A
MAASWDVLPKNGTEEFFSRDVYDRYTMAPTFSELWALVSRQTVEVSDTPTPPELQHPPNQSTKPQPSSPAKPTSKGSVATFPLPEPRVPYPRFSALSGQDQRNYVQFMEKYKNVQRPGRLQGKVYGYLAQYSELKNAVWNEMPDFMKYLQNAARACAEDYDVISPDALRYTEEVLGAWNEVVKKYPELYTVNEITSIMGGKFNPDLTLHLEKKLLCLGNALFLRVPTPASSKQLTTDYKTIATFAPPITRAPAFESEISSDVNAEKLSVKYGATVSLTSQALFTLLNNCGPNYTEPWEVPVHVKTICGNGNKMVKVVCIDSPLVKKELTVREKNLLFYDVPLDLLMSKKYYTHVSQMTLDKPESGDPSEENVFRSSEQRSINTFESSDIDFDADFTDLETFGSISSGPSKRTSQKGAAAKACKRASMTSDPLPASVTVKKPTEEKSLDMDIPKKIIQEKQLLASLSKPNCGRKSNTVETIDSKQCHTSEQQKTDSMKEKGIEAGSGTLAGTDSDEMASLKGLESERDVCFGDSDSDGERLVIDTNYVEGGNVCESMQTVPSDSRSIAEKLDLQGPEEIIPDTPQSPGTDQDTPSSQTPKSTGPMRRRKGAKALSKEFDPVGQILKMQCKLLSPNPKRLVDQPQINQEPSSLHGNPAPGQLPLDGNPTPIPIPESHNSAAIRKFKTAQSTRTHLLTEELLDCDEAASDYTAPPTGNVTYKLFSLASMLLLVRGNVQKAQIRPRSNKGVSKKHVPIYVLPKLEYQSSYGIEAFTESEICRLWTESLLNSNAWFYIGHIDVFTSKLILIDQFPATSIAERFGAFKPVNSLNILHHILKKVSSLPEGNYLLSHPTGDSSITIYRSLQGGKFTRAAYNLHAAHSTLPQIPSTLSVPWVPLDPSVLLPYHIHHGRAPCTFPPRSLDNVQDQKFQMGAAKANSCIPARGQAVTMETRSRPSPAQHPGNEKVAPKKRKNKGKRACRRKRWKNKQKLRQAQSVQEQ